MKNFSVFSESISVSFQTWSPLELAILASGSVLPWDLLHFRPATHLKGVHSSEHSSTPQFSPITLSIQ